MDPNFAFWLPFLVLFGIIVYLDRNYDMLRDVSSAQVKPFSWSRVQLAWWTLVIMPSFVSVIICDPAHEIPNLTTSTLILLGISGATSVASAMIDISDQNDPNTSRHQDNNGRNFLLDIISDQDGASIHRLQTVIFNLTIGLWFIGHVTYNLNAHVAANLVIPDIEPSSLILLGVSTGTYAAMKATENKNVQTDLVPDEAQG